MGLNLTKTNLSIYCVSSRHNARCDQILKYLGKNKNIKMRIRVAVHSDISYHSDRNKYESQRSGFLPVLEY